MVDCPQPHCVAISCWVNPAATISEIMFDQFICEGYRNTDSVVKRLSGIIYRYNGYMEDIERTPFGRRLFAARSDAGLSQEEVVKSVGMSQSTLSEAEISGKRSGFTSQLAALYKVHPTWLATGKGRKEVDAQLSAPPEPPARDPILDDLDALEPDDADVFRNQLAEVEARLARIKSEIRAAANKARKRDYSDHREVDSKKGKRAA